MINLDNLKQERTKYIKAYRNCRPLSNQSNKEFLEMQKGFAKRYAELDKQIKRIATTIANFLDHHTLSPARKQDNPCTTDNAEKVRSKDGITMWDFFISSFVRRRMGIWSLTMKKYTSRTIANRIVTHPP